MAKFVKTWPTSHDLFGWYLFDKIDTAYDLTPKLLTDLIDDFTWMTTQQRIDLHKMLYEQYTEFRELFLERNS